MPSPLLTTPPQSPLPILSSINDIHSLISLLYCGNTAQSIYSQFFAPHTYHITACYSPCNSHNLYTLIINEKTPGSIWDFFCLNFCRAISDLILTTGMIQRSESDLDMAILGRPDVVQYLTLFRHILLFFRRNFTSAQMLAMKHLTNSHQPLLSHHQAVTEQLSKNADKATTISTIFELFRHLSLQTTLHGAKLLLHSYSQSSEFKTMRPFNQFPHLSQDQLDNPVIAIPSPFSHFHTSPYTTELCDKLFDLLIFTRFIHPPSFQQIYKAILANQTESHPCFAPNDNSNDTTSRFSHILDQSQDTNNPTETPPFPPLQLYILDHLFSHPPQISLPFCTHHAKRNQTVTIFIPTIILSILSVFFIPHIEYFTQETTSKLQNMHKNWRYIQHWVDFFTTATTQFSNRVITFPTTPTTELTDTTSTSTQPQRLPLFISCPTSGSPAAPPQQSPPHPTPPLSLNVESHFEVIKSALINIHHLPTFSQNKTLTGTTTRHQTYHAISIEAGPKTTRNIYFGPNRHQFQLPSLPLSCTPFPSPVHNSHFFPSLNSTETDSTATTPSNSSLPLGSARTPSSIHAATNSSRDSNRIDPSLLPNFLFLTTYVDAFQQDPRLRNYPSQSPHQTSNSHQLPNIPAQSNPTASLYTSVQPDMLVNRKQHYPQANHQHIYSNQASHQPTLLQEASEHFSEHIHSSPSQPNDHLSTMKSNELNTDTPHLSLPTSLSTQTSASTTTTNTSLTITSSNSNSSTPNIQLTLEDCLISLTSELLDQFYSLQSQPFRPYPLLPPLSTPLTLQLSSYHLFFPPNNADPECDPTTNKDLKYSSTPITTTLGSILKQFFAHDQLRAYEQLHDGCIAIRDENQQDSIESANSNQDQLQPTSQSHSSSPSHQLSTYLSTAYTNTYQSIIDKVVLPFLIAFAEHQQSNHSPIQQSILQSTHTPSPGSQSPIPQSTLEPSSTSTQTPPIQSLSTLFQSPTCHHLAPVPTSFFDSICDDQGRLNWDSFIQLISLTQCKICCQPTQITTSANVPHVGADQQSSSHENGDICCSQLDNNHNPLQTSPPALCDNTDINNMWNKIRFSSIQQKVGWTMFFLKKVENL